eukprot:scaffold743_cov117-Cylindrotheca_fusiformis.AAC.4
MNRISLAILFSLFASIQAFVPVSPPKDSHTKVGIMTQEETENIMKHATDCTHGECSVDEVSELVSVLKGHQKDLRDRVEEVKKITKALETVHSRGAKVDEVQETVRALFRVFQLGDKASGNDYPALSRPTGWSGDVGKGPQTAYDVLSPKRSKK